MAPVRLVPSLPPEDSAGVRREAAIPSWAVSRMPVRRHYNWCGLNCSPRWSGGWLRSPFRSVINRWTPSGRAPFLSKSGLVVFARPRDSRGYPLPSPVTPLRGLREHATSVTTELPAGQTQPGNDLDADGIPKFWAKRLAAPSASQVTPNAIILLVGAEFINGVFRLSRGKLHSGHVIRARPTFALSSIVRLAHNPLVLVFNGSKRALLPIGRTPL